MSNQTANVAKTFVLALAGMVAIFFGVGTMLADHWSVETRRTVAAPPAKVASLLGNFDAWESWSSMKITVGPQVERKVTGAPGAVGHRVAWTGSEGGASLTLARVEPGCVAYEYRSVRPGETEEMLAGSGEIRFQPEGAGTLVVWRDGGTWPNLAMRWIGWFGGIQERVKQIQTSSLEGLAKAAEPETAPPAPVPAPQAPTQPK